MAAKAQLLLSSIKYAAVELPKTFKLCNSPCLLCLSKQYYCVSPTYNKSDNNEKGVVQNGGFLSDNTEPKCVIYSKNVIPGKGRPPEPPVDCCMSGCANCVWIAYAEELKKYYCDGGKLALEALDMIENPSLKAFVKLELNLK